MATPKTRNGGSGVSDKKLRGLWKNITSGKLVELLRLKNPTGRWSVSGNTLKGCCPFHDDKTPSFTINLDRGFAQCWGCEKFVGNPVDFWAKVTSTPRSVALGDLKQYFTLDSISDASGTKMAVWDRAQRVKRDLMRLAHDELMTALNSPNDPEYAQAQPAVQYLLTTRKIPAAALHCMHMVGVLPPILRVVNILNAEAEERNAIEEAAAAEEDRHPVLETGLAADAMALMQAAQGWTGALAFSLDKSPETISGIKLRRPNTKEIIVIAKDEGEGVGFFGLTWRMNKPFLGVQQEFCAPYIVEGEFDALSIMAQQVLAGAPSFMVLSAGGSAGAANIDELYDIGFDTVNLVSDSPLADGDKLIGMWLRGVESRTGIDRLHARVFTGWGLWPGAKDPDEAVVNLGLPLVEKTLLDIGNEDLFKTPALWLIEGLKEEMASTPPDQSRRRVELASAAGKTLQNKNDSEDFAQRCATLFDIEVGALKREIASQTDTPEGYIYRVAAEIERRLFVIGTLREGGRQVLRMWNRKDLQSVSINVNDNMDIQQALIKPLGPAWKFIDEDVGAPDWLDLATHSSKQGLAIMRKTVNYQFIIKEALNVLTREATDLSHVKTLGAGIHRVDKGADVELYFVNGTSVYHGAYAGNSLRWTALEGPAHGGHVFDMDSPQWAKNINSVDDLKRASEIDVNACVDKLEKILNLGWKFRNQEVTAKFLALHIMASTLSSAFDRKVIVSFNADTSAGKTKLLLGLLAGLQDTDIHLLEATVGLRTYSAAGFKQGMHEKALSPCIDEFESNGDKSSAAVDNILSTIFRGIHNGNNTQVMGSRGGKATGYSLNFFVFLAAIHRPPNPQDANRMIQVAMEKVAHRSSPDSLILSKYTVDELSELRNDLTIALLPHAKALRDHFRTLDRELVPDVSTGVKIEDRMKSGLLPALSVLRLTGGDARNFLLEYCAANADQLVSTGSRTDSKDIFDWITQSAQISLETSTGKVNTSFLALLNTKESRALVNESGTGLYFDETSSLLVVNWTMATQSVLRLHPRFGRSTSATNLRELANRVSFAVSTEALEASGALIRLRKYGFHGISAHNLTGYNIAHLLEQEVPATDADEKNATVIQLPKKKNNDDGNFG